MGVRSHAAAPLPRARPRGPGFGPTAVVAGVAFLLLVANGRPVGTPDTSGAAAWLLRGGLALAGLVVRLDATGEALVGKALAALFAALGAAALFAAVVRRHGPSDAWWAGLLLALGTTLAAAAQAWSGEAAATFAVAAALLLLVRGEGEEEAGPAVRAGLPLGLAVALEPSTAALAAVLAGAVILRWRWKGLLVLAWAAPGVLVALGGPRPFPLGPGAGPAAGGLALLASPAKGAFVFAPVALVGLAGLLRALRAPSRRLWDQPQPSRLLAPACLLAAAAHFAALAYGGGWAAGEFWGPRGVAPAWPLLMLFVPEGFALLGFLASLLALASVAVQTLGAVAYDGRWDRVYREPSGELRGALWDARNSPIPFQVRERTARLALPALDGGRLVQRTRVLAPEGASGSFVSFARTPPAPGGVERTISALRYEAGARLEGGRLELRAAGDGVAFRVPEGAWPRRLELRVAGSGRGTLGLGESDYGRETRWREKDVNGTFRLRLPYHQPESGGPDLVLVLRRGGPVALDSVALVPPDEPENVLRLP